MKILAPVNDPREVERLVRAGADQIYCGVLPANWTKNYTNMASVNRREWRTANLPDFGQLKEVVKTAHLNNVPVFLTLNALYTVKQYPMIMEQIDAAVKTRVDALIVADLGLLLTLKELKTGLNVHISAGGTTFNSETVRFFREIGCSRIILPRDLKIEEMRQIVTQFPGLEFEAFILNSGCKNIDGFCTFQHGSSELLHGALWNLPKKLNFDRHILNAVRSLPPALSCRIKPSFFGVDSPCLLNYKITCLSASGEAALPSRKVLKNISFGFNLISGADSCGACRLAELSEMGISGVKIVGRNYATDKKVRDITFLRAVLSYLESGGPLDKRMKEFIKKTFKRIYKVKCGELCYYPE